MTGDAFSAAVILAAGSTSAAVSVAAAHWLPGFLDALWSREEDDETTAPWFGALVQMERPPRALLCPRNFIVFLGLVALAGWSLQALPSFRTAFAATIFCGAAAAAALIDLDTAILPDAIVLPLLWAGLLVNASGGGFAPLDMAVYGAVAAYSSLRALNTLSLAATGRNGMYEGDFKMFAAIGAWLGLKALVPVMIIALLGFVLYAAIRAVAGQAVRNEEVPFGPYLAIGGIVALECHPYLHNALRILQ